MFRKLNSKTLLVLLAVLIALLAIVYFIDQKKGSRTIKEELAKVDTSSVTSFAVFPQVENHKEITLKRNGKHWKVQKDKITAEADTGFAHNILSAFALIKPQRLAATGKDKWKEFSVNDSLGTRIKFYSDNDVLLDIVVGKFGYNNTTRTGVSYMRLYDEKEVYAVEGFIAMEVNRQFKEWRNKMIFTGKKDNFTRLTFAYPADSGFVLIKDKDKWKIGDSKADSTKVENFLNGISYVNSAAFVDNYQASSMPLLSLTIEGSNMMPAAIKAFGADSITKYIINSSYNPAAYFSANENRLDERLFKGKRYFLTAATKAVKTKGRK